VWKDGRGERAGALPLGNGDCMVCHLHGTAQHSTHRVHARSRASTHTNTNAHRQTHSQTHAHTCLLDLLPVKLTFFSCLEMYPMGANLVFDPAYVQYARARLCACVRA
jgi:hypothetical protein